MQVKWAGIIVAALVSGLLAACGGGGGGGGQTGAGDGATASSSGVRLSTKRVYGDEWQMSVQQTLQDKSSRSLVRRYRVEAVKPSGVYSLSIRASDLDGTTPDTVSTDQYDANNNKMSAGQCVSAADGPSRSTFVKGEQWTTTGVVSCLDDDPVQTSWSTVDEMTVTKAGIPFHVYQLHRVSVTQPLVTGGALQDPSLPSRIEATCLWAPDIGMYIHCESTSTYARALQDSVVVNETFDLSGFQPGDASATPPAPTSSTYPAVQASLPQVSPPPLQAQPEVLSTPRLVPVYYDNTPAQDQKTAFLKRLIVSESWPVLQEYGVKAATVADAVPLHLPAPAAIQDSEIQAKLIEEITSGAITPDPNNFLVVFYPSSTTVTAGGGNKSCAGFNAYHSALKMASGARVAYAVVPDCMQGRGTLTVAISHEILEGVVDPYQTGYRTIPGDASWVAAFDGAEIGDMCEHNTDSSSREESQSGGVSYHDYIARVWSNASAKAGHNPCVPKRTPIQSDVYFNSVPQLDDTVRLTHGGNVGLAKGVIIAPGQSKAIQVRLFSDGPTYGEWNVHATWMKRGTDDASDPMTFHWDRTSGQNGDVLTLTIQAPAAPMPNGGLFTIESHYAGVTTIWTGVVANEAATATATVIAGSVTQGKAVDGSGAAAEFGAGGRLAMAADGRSLLVANLNVLRKVGLDGQVSTLSGNGLLANPEALATDTAHSAVYVAGEKGVVAAGSATTSWSRYVQRIDANGIATSLKASSGSDTVYGGNAGSGGMAMGPDGLLYVAATAANQILVVDPRTGASAPYAGRPDGSAGADDGGLSVASFSHPTGLSFDAQGNLYVCDTGNHQIRKISPEGVVSSLAGTTTAGYANGQGAKARFGAPSDIVFDRFAGVLYVADGALVREVGLDGGVRTLIGGDLGYGFYGLTVDAQGALYATATGGLAGVVRISGMH